MDAVNEYATGYGEDINMMSAPEHGFYDEATGLHFDKPIVITPKKTTETEPIKTFSPYEEAQKEKEEAMQKEIEEWLLALAREDQIRYEQYEREDTAWQRAKADAIKAGVDLNLVNAGPASTGAGITNASRIDKTERIANTQTAREILIQQLAQKFEKEENRKDRTEKYINNTMDNLTSILNKVLDKLLPSLNATSISKVK